jgi:hypothetical protein
VALPAAVKWKDKGMASLAAMALVKRRLRALGAGEKAARSYSPFITLVIDQLRKNRLTRRYRKWAALLAG